MREVVVLAFPDVQSLDLFGPHEVLSTATALTGGADGYRVRVVARSADPLRLSTGLRIVPDEGLPPPSDVDTLLVPGGTGVVEALRDAQLITWIRDAASRSRRVASVCNGAFLLAAAGLLDGRRATTHWAACDELARCHPSVRVDRDAIFVRDGDVYTSAGVTAGIDLALALVESDLGHRLALEVARWLVLFVKRPGGQSQFSAHLSGGAAERGSIRELQEWMSAHLSDDLSVAALAERAFMSPRNFARAFKAEVGQTPAAYVESLRLERARLELEEGGAGIEEVASRCGFGTVETLRRAFVRRLGVNPSDYRSRFRAAA